MGAPLLTFDDGPSASTETILDLLGEYGIRATFFVIGFRAEQRCDLVRRAAAEGHVIGNHTWDHVALADYLDGAQGEADFEQRAAFVKEKLQQANTLISGILGTPPALFRAPYLSINEDVTAIAASIGLSHMDVDVDAHDYYHDGRDHDANCVKNAILGAQADQIVLLHDGTGDVREGPINPPRPTTVEALRLALPGFAERWH